MTTKRRRSSALPLSLLLVAAALHAACGSSSSEATATTGATTSTSTSTTSTSTTGTTSTDTGSGGSAAGGSGGGGASAGGAGGAGGAAAPHPGLGEPCDVLAQDCADPAAAKCALDFVDPAELPSVCAPVLGDKQAGDACTRPNEVKGEDDCAPGLYCSPAGNPVATPQPRTCYPLCNTNEACGDGKFCTRFNANPGGPLPADVRLIGICVPRCDFWDPTTCAAGTKCLTSTRIDGLQLVGTTDNCFGTKGVKKGEPCTTNEECGVGLGCSAGTCATFCDDAHPTCDADTEICPPSPPSQVAFCKPT